MSTYLPSQSISQTSRLSRLLLILALTIAPSSAALVTYDLTFFGGQPLPSSGRFVYDTVAGSFTSFTVNWVTLTVDMTSTVNWPTSQTNSGSPFCPQNTAPEIFTVLTSGGTCNGLPLALTWQTFNPNPQGNVFTGTMQLSLFNSNNQGVLFGGATFGPPFLIGPVIGGTFTVTESVPEPTTASLVLACALIGGLRVIAKRRGRR